MKYHVTYRLITSKNSVYSKCVKLRRERLWQPLHLVTPDDFEKTEENSVFIVAIVNLRQTVGCVRLTAEPNNNWIRLSQLVVAEDYCKEGVGSQLVGMGIAYAQKENYNRMALYAYPDVLSFFERFGFETEGKWYSHVNQVRSILMIKNLQQTDL